MRGKGTGERGRLNIMARRWLVTAVEVGPRIVNITESPRILKSNTRTNMGVVTELGVGLRITGEVMKRER